MEDSNRALRILLKGEKFVNMEDEFNVRMGEIELEHSDWFEKNENFHSSSELDTLGNHWVLYDDGSRLMFSFMPESNLPAVIRNKCQNAFSDTYK
ncbi:hypothetical protein FA048_06495 [Pedobacter polaris]|uniref:Uncharacterized protein n=1 Tax=Pedobacter polaris TaxID=2571273 RepID=A0A4U1CVC4_9SPHI|nr:hypothetical protein [Pedobacter polaris]TKC09858.1 hypothetical protein FA048_06495 [Pedobacter polaris]